MPDHGPRHRFYVDEELRAGQAYSLSSNASEQIRKVLRLKLKDQVIVFDGSGREAVARIVSLKRNQTTVEVVSDPVSGRTGGVPRIHLAISLLKSDRFETVVQKATELGVASITPLETDRSVVSLPADRLPSRLERWQRIAIEALEQSGRSDWVQICGPRSLEDACSELDAGQKLIAWEDEAGGAAIASVVDRSAESIAILIGPEGGFTEREVETARDAGFVSVSLGDLILRSETAAIAAIAVIRLLGAPARESTNERED